VDGWDMIGLHPMEPARKEIKKEEINPRNTNKKKKKKKETNKVAIHPPLFVHLGLVARRIRVANIFMHVGWPTSCSSLPPFYFLFVIVWPLGWMLPLLFPFMALPSL